MSRGPQTKRSAVPRGTALLFFGGPDPVVGLDEVGRGPLAGPVVAAAVVLGPEAERALPGLGDSKALSPARRAALAPLIRSQALAWAVASASVGEIERWNILGASLLAMRRACAALPLAPTRAVVDGNQDPGLGLPTDCVVGGDGSVACVAAASILAKVTRDAWMEALDPLYPGYGLAIHKGYGTAFHRERVRTLGPSRVHRPSFLGRILEDASA